MQTGRTTRMLQEAIDAAEQGQYVAVVSLHADVERLLTQCATMCESERAGETAKLYVGKGSITFESPNGSWDWDTLRHRGMQPSVPVHVDHHTIEVTFAGLLHELYRYDA